MDQTDWRQVVTETTERKIFEALEDRRWDWRTISALARASGLSAESARRVIQKYPILVRQSAVLGPGGEDIYTLQSRYFERQSVGEKFWNTVSSSTFRST